MRSTSSRAADPRAADPQAGELERLERLAHRMDSAFRIPGTGFRVGWDGILGLIPGIGDAAALAPALYILWRAQKLGAPPVLLGRMAAWVAADTSVGAVPVIGDIFDIGLKANRRNVALLRDHLGRSPASPPPGR